MNPQNLAKRELPPGTWSQLYLVYTAHCLSEGKKAACRSVYYQVVKTWKRCLSFRRRSQHSACFTCDRLKASMRHATCFWEHAKACDALLAHLTRQWACRQVYWGARAESQKKRGLLTVILDGFDHSKAMLPRWTAGRTPKGGAFDRVLRPHMNISCGLAHGYGCFIFIADEFTSTGASYQWECLLRILDTCFATARAEGRMQPDTVWLQCDNTVKELKNSITGRLMCSLISQGHIRECGHHHLEVGHTHEDCGPLGWNTSVYTLFLICFFVGKGCQVQLFLRNCIIPAKMLYLEWWAACSDLQQIMFKVPWTWKGISAELLCDLPSKI